MQVLDASENDIRDIDMAFSGLTMLREIDLSKNRLTTLPNFWTNMSHLINLNVCKFTISKMHIDYIFNFKVLL